MSTEEKRSWRFWEVFPLPAAFWGIQEEIQGQVYPASSRLSSPMPHSTSTPRPLLLIPQEVQCSQRKSRDEREAASHLTFGKHPSLVPQDQRRWKLYSWGDGGFVNMCGVYAKYQLKLLGSFVHQLWLAHRAQKTDAEEASRKAILVTSAVPQLVFEHLLYSLGQQRREAPLRRHTL